MAIDQADFDLRTLYDALDEQRRARQMSWAAVASAVNGLRTRRRAIAASTITGLKRKPVGEGDGILQMLLWLRRTRLVRWLDQPAAVFTRIADW